MGMLEFSQMLITKACWGKLIDLFVKWLGNYGWAIILLTIALKLVLSPIDVIQKRMNKKNAKMQALMQPELQKIQEQFPNDRNKLNQKQMELSKKYNFNMTGTCLTLLITMIITIVVFTSLFIGIRSLSEKQENVAFNEIYQTYTTAVEYTKDPTNTQFLNEDLTPNEDAINNYIHEQVNAKYKEQSKKYSFMWVQNVWKKDTTTSPVVNYSSFEKYALKNGIVEEANLEQFKKDYESISNIITAKHKYNGCYILIILAGLITFLSQWLQAKIQKRKGAPASPNSKIMYIIMPLFMIIFASSSSALFTLYIITSSVMSTLISIVADLLQGKDKDDPAKVIYKKGNTEVVEYSRNYNKG